MSYRRKHIKPKIKHLRHTKKFFQKPLFWIFLLVVIIIAVLSYFLLFFSKFQISTIKVSGNEQINSQDIERIVQLDITRHFFTLSSKSIFTVDAKNTVKDILHTFAGVENVQLIKNFPNSLTLEIKERQPFLVFCTNEVPTRCFFMDGNGIIFEPLQSIPAGMVVLTKEDNSKKNNAGDQVVSKNVVDMISKVKKNLQDAIGVDIKEILVSNYLVVTTSENWQIDFDMNSDISAQITKMNALLQTGIPADARKKLQYIYLQYKDRAYYK
jgi:cell division septal protein FtsQ